MPRTVRSKKQQRTLTNKNPEAAANGQPTNKGGSPGRKANGQFARGNAGGPGNPHARFSAQMLTIARQTMTPEKMTAVFEAIYVKALTGDMSAAKLLLHYTIGKPGVAPHPDYIERDEWDLYQKNTMSLAEVMQALGSLPCSLGNEIVGAALPSMTATRANELAAQLRGEEIGARGERKDEGGGMKDEPNGRRHVAVSESTQDQTATAVDPWNVDVAPPLTNRKTEAGTMGGKSSPTPRYQPPTTDTSSQATRRNPPTTSRSPLTIGNSDGSVGSKKGRKLVATQWLQPLAKKLTGSKQKSKKRSHARA